MRDLLAAAEIIFVRDGYDRAQIETIAAEAGRTRGAIYAHFASKEDIFFALMETKAQGQLDLYVREARDVLFEEKVRTALQLFLRTMKEENWLILLLEFKLFALRNKASHDRIHSLTEMLYDDISRDLLTGLGLSKAEKQLALTAFTVLRSLPSAMALERRFNPGTSSGAPLRQVLETVFNAMVNIGHHPEPVTKAQAARFGRDSSRNKAHAVSSPETSQPKQ